LDRQSFCSLGGFNFNSSRPAFPGDHLQTKPHAKPDHGILDEQGAGPRDRNMIVMAERRCSEPATLPSAGIFKLAVQQ
jgi:hypothetical protein